MSKIKNFFSSFSVKKLLDNKRFTLPFSVFLSIVMWLVIVTNENPIIQRSFTDMSVNVNLENTLASENGMSIIEDISTQKFTVVVRGSSYAVSSLKSEDISLYASAASVDSPGEYSLDVAVANSSSNYEILSISPATIRVSFDYIDTKEFTIKPKAEGVTASEGLIAENGVVSGTESDTVTITGPRTVMNQIDSVVAYTKVNKTLSASETFDADIILYDAEGNEIDTNYLTISTTKVKVTVPISKSKTVPVVVDFSNLPDGFDKNSISYTLDYSEVTVIGTPETVDKTTQVTLSAIDITTVSPTTNSFEVSAKLPEGVRLYDNIEAFTVAINTENYKQKTINVSNIQYTGLTSGLSVSETSEIKSVKICGPTSVINKLNSESVYAVIDLTAKTAGQHSVEAVIKFKDKNNIWAVGTYNTTVTVK